LIQSKLTPEATSGATRLTLAGSGRAVAIALICGELLLFLTGCGGSGHQPFTLVVVPDTTVSYAPEAPGCVPDLMRAVEAAAVSRGRVTGYSFDGDPLSPASSEPEIARDFTDNDVPPAKRGTNQADDALRQAADELRPQINALASESPRIGGSPFRAVLERAGRLRLEHQVEGTLHVLICSDGLSTDPGPDTPIDVARQMGSELAPGLRGAVIDVVGVGINHPGSAPRTEASHQVLEALANGAGARIGIWDAQLPPAYPTD
jgi:hypothetical protein